MMMVIEGQYCDGEERRETLWFYVLWSWCVSRRIVFYGVWYCVTYYF
jgi:hypothetical protein